MAVSYVLSGLDTNTPGATTVTCSVPPHSDGDVLCAIVYCNEQAAFSTAQSGWQSEIQTVTSAGSDHSQALFWVTASSEPTSVIFSHDGVAGTVKGYMIAFDQTTIDTATPFDGTTVALDEILNTDNPNPPAITIATPGTRIFVSLTGTAFDGVPMTPPTGCTLDLDQQVALNVALASYSASTSGSVDLDTWSSAGAGADSSMIVFAIQAAAAGGIAPIAHYYRHIL